MKKNVLRFIAHMACETSDKEARQVLLQACITRKYEAFYAFYYVKYGAEG